MYLHQMNHLNFVLFFSNSYTVLNFRYAEVMKIFSVDFFLHYNNSKIKLFFLQEKRIILLSNGCPSCRQRQRLDVLVITVIYKYMRSVFEFILWRIKAMIHISVFLIHSLGERWTD